MRRALAQVMVVEAVVVACHHQVDMVPGLMSIVRAHDHPQGLLAVNHPREEEEVGIEIAQKIHLNHDQDRPLPKGEEDMVVMTITVADDAV